jgi:hypothetical protein
LAEWRSRIERGWSKIRILESRIERPDRLKVDDAVTVRAWIDLGELHPADLAVGLWYGPLNAQGETQTPRQSRMNATKERWQGMNMSDPLLWRPAADLATRSASSHATKAWMFRTDLDLSRGPEAGTGKFNVSRRHRGFLT